MSSAQGLRLPQPAEMIASMRRLGLKLAGGALVLAIGAVLVAGSDDRPSCIELHGDQTLDIDLANLTNGTVHFFCFRDNAGEKVRFLLARDADGEVESAFDACKQCYKYRKGYTVSHGELICRVCGNHYKLSQIHTGKASCVPVNLPSTQTGQSVKVKVSDLEHGHSLF
jgi:uncharacterized membrane protein